MSFARNARSARRLALAAALLLCAGCSRRTDGMAAAWHDPNPLPVDTMTVRVNELGVHGGRFVIASPSGPKTLNPILANETSSTDVVDRMFTSLTEFDNETQQVVPMLARSWEVSADSLTWTWHLRRGAAFSDGHPITSADVLFAFEVAYDEELHPSIQDLLMVGGRRMEVSAPDSYTVVTRVATPYVLVVPAIGSLRIIPKHILEPAFRRGAFASSYGVNTPPESLVTSGPFRLEQYVAGEKVVLGRNPWWFGVDPKGQRLPYLDQLVYLIVPDQAAAALRFQSGDVDGLENVKPEDYAEYERGQRQGRYTLHDLGPSLNSNFLWFNLNRVREPKAGFRVGDPQVGAVKYAWFSNPDFRRAVSMAIDRGPIIRSVFFGEGVENWSVMTPGNRLFYTGKASPWTYDPEKAKALLASIGFRDGNGDGVLEDRKGNPVSFTLKTNGDNAVRVAMCNFVRDDLARVGIRCTPAPMDFNAFVTNLRADMQYDAALLGLSSAVPPDPGMGMNVLRSSGHLHYWNMKQPRPETPEEARIDRLMDANVATGDLAERRRTWAEIERIVNDQCWIVWLPTQKLKLPVRDKFGNVSPSPVPHRLLWNIDRVFVKPQAQRA